ncbi:hypothetical protein FF2_037634 [Malus domestica]
MLSKTGKEVLLKAACQVVPSYTMSVFHIPMSCSELESIMARFWWSKGERRVSIGKIGNSCVNPKLMEEWVSMLKARYFENSEFMSAELGSAPSYTWRSIYGVVSYYKLCVGELGMFRQVMDNAGCWRCQGEIETTIHAMRDCPLSKHVLSSLDFPMSVMEISYDSTLQWLMFAS